MKEIQIFNNYNTTEYKVDPLHLYPNITDNITKSVSFPIISRDIITDICQLLQLFVCSYNKMKQTPNQVQNMFL